MGWRTKTVSNGKNVGKRWVKKKKQSKYTQKCLYLCKSWNRPAIRIDELREILKANCGKAENIVQIELSYYRGTYKADVVQQPDLFSINKISHEERLLNLCALLSEHEPLSNYVTLPSNADAETLVSSSPNYCIENEDSIHIGENYATLIVEGNTNTWYIATCTKNNDDGTYEIDGKFVLISSKNIYQKLILIIWNQSWLWSVISMASGMCRKRRTWQIY